MNNQTSNQNSRNFKTGKAALKGFCRAHKKIGEFVCEKCRVFYCDSCIRQSNSAVVKCDVCDNFCTKLKKSNYPRANKKNTSFGLDADELKKSFIVTEYSFVVLALCLGGLYLSNTIVYLFTFGLLSGVFVHRVKLILENKPVSKWSDFEIDNWVNYSSSAISATLILIVCFAPAIIFAKLAISGMPYLEMALSSPDPQYTSTNYSQNIKEEFSLLFNFNWSSLEKEKRVIYGTGRKNSNIPRSVPETNCFFVDTPDARPNYIDPYRQLECKVQNERIVDSGAIEPEQPVYDEAHFAELKFNFWWTKIFACLLIGSLVWGIFYIPLAFGNCAVSDSIAAALNISKWRRLAKNLTEDYGRVFFYWLCFLLLFAGTVYLEITMRNGSVFVSIYKTQTVGYSAMQFFIAVFRFYLLYVLATMVGKMFYKNRLTVRI
jgi:hypothetical protein